MNSSEHTTRPAIPEAKPVANRASLLSWVLNDAIWAFLFGFVGRLLAYGVQFYLAAALGAMAFGLFLLGLSLVQVTSAVVGLGLYMVLVRYVAILRDRNAFSELRRLILFVVIMPVMAAGAVAASFLHMPYWWSELLGQSTGLDQLLPSAGLALIALVVQRLMVSILNGVGLARQRSLFENLLPWACMAVVVACLAVLDWIAPGQTQGSGSPTWLTLHNVMIAYASCMGVGAIVAAAATFHALRRLSTAGTIESIKVGMPSAADSSATEHSTLSLREVAGFAVPMWLVILLSQLSQRIDILLGARLLDGVDLGVYSAAALMTIALGFTINAFNMAAAPSFANWNSRNTDELASLYRDGTRILVSIGLPVAICFALGSRQILLLLGSSYTAGSIALPILVLGQLANVAVGPAGNVLVMSGHQRIELVLVTFSVSMNIILASWLTPLWGTTGLALATALSVTGLNIGRLLGVYLQLDVLPYDRGYWRLAASTVPALVLGGALNRFVAGWPSPALALVAMLFTVCTAYLLALVVLGVVDGKMVRQFCGKLIAGNFVQRNASS